jgi:VanZ family protein
MVRGHKRVSKKSEAMTAMGSLFERSKRVAAWGALVAIGILSMLPATEVSPVRTSMGGHVEHLLVYAATALLTAIAYVDHSKVKIVASLILYAAALEYLQRYAPGRLSSLLDLTFSTTGVLIGLAIFHVIRLLRERHARGAAVRNPQMPI